MKAKTKNKKGPGRPTTVKWSKANLVWKTKTNAEIARMLGCTPAAVCIRRKNLKTQELLAGRDGSKYATKEGVKFRREASKKGQSSRAKVKA